MSHADFIDAQLTSLETNIEQTQAEIDKLKVELAISTAPAIYSRTQQEITSSGRQTEHTSG
jgi:hypothetical protein